MEGSNMFYLKNALSHTEFKILYLIRCSTILYLYCFWNFLLIWLFPTIQIDCVSELSTKCCCQKSTISPSFVDNWVIFVNCFIIWRSWTVTVYGVNAILHCYVWKGSPYFKISLLIWFCVWSVSLELHCIRMWPVSIVV